MDPLRKRLAELRDSLEPDAAACNQVDAWSVMYDIESILADWDAADEIRPTQCEAEDQEQDK